MRRPSASKSTQTSLVKRCVRTERLAGASETAIASTLGSYVICIRGSFIRRGGFIHPLHGDDYDDVARLDNDHTGFPPSEIAPATPAQIPSRERVHARPDPP